MLKPAFWNRHCQVLHHDGNRAGSFIMYPFLTENKAFAPGARGRWATVWVFLCTTLYLTWFQSQHTQSFLCLQPTYLNTGPLPTIPSLQLFAHFSELYFSCLWPRSSGKKKDLPTPKLLFAIDLDSFGTGAFASLKDQDSQLKGRFSWN